MSRKKPVKKTKQELGSTPEQKSSFNKPSNNFHIEFLNQAQREAWSIIDKNDITFLVGPAGSAKSFLSTAYAVKSVLSKTHKRIILSRPVVEAGGEKIGFLPGMMEEKLLPYLLPIYDNLDEMIGKTGFQRELINKCLEVAPIAFLRGRSFHESVCILDEAQNITYEQMVLYLTRIGRKGKLIINGDPMQSDLRTCCLPDIIKKLDGIQGIGVVKLDNNAIVRNPIISQILERL
jgi:phosphate starvation-inducible PhoH-like protein